MLFLTTTHGYNIIPYDSPLVTISDGKGFTLDGYFKLIHLVNLTKFDEMMETFKSSLRQLPETHYKSIIVYHLNITYERLNHLKGHSLWRARSINWLGSAWKWIAGNPDATDWNNIVQFTERMSENNNEQYKINEKLFTKNAEIIEGFNNVLESSKNAIEKLNLGEIESAMLQQVLLLRDSVNEITRAVQMARNNMVNTNLLDKSEINKILQEIDTLPYANEVEAVEYGKPSVYCNGSMLLYSLAMPKVGNTEFKAILVRAPIKEGLQLDLPFRRMLISNRRLYGVTGKCMVMNNSTICSMEALIEIQENDCVNKLLKGGHASCEYVTNNEVVVEALNEDTVYLSNFKGNIVQGVSSKSLQGTFIIKLMNETITIGNRSFTSKFDTNTMALPQVLSNITSRRRKLDVGLVHELNIQNIKRLQGLDEKHVYSVAIDIAIILVIILVLYWVWHKMNINENLPALNPKIDIPKTPES